MKPSQEPSIQGHEAISSNQQGHEGDHHKGYQKIREERLKFLKENASKGAYFKPEIYSLCPEWVFSFPQAEVVGQSKEIPAGRKGAVSGL